MREFPGFAVNLRAESHKRAGARDEHPRLILCTPSLSVQRANNRANAGEYFVWRFVSCWPKVRC
jgi:hypothetical protein